jgi:hypothetical protein
VQAAQVAVPAGGGRVEAPIHSALLSLAPADAKVAGKHSLLYARVTTSKDVPAGVVAGLTF